MHVNEQNYYWGIDTGFVRQGERFILDNQASIKIKGIPTKANGDPFDYTLAVREFFDLTDSDPSTGTLLHNITGSLSSLTTREKEITFDLPSANFEQGKVYSLEFMLTDPDNPINVRGVQITFEVQKRSITSIGSLIQQFFSAAFTLSGNAIDSATNKIVDQNYIDNAANYKTYITVGFSNADYIVDGTDDHIQIQAAIDAVGTAGAGVIWIKPGTYNCDTLLLKNSADYHFILDNAVIKKNDNVIGHIIENSTTKGSYDVAIPSLTIDCQNGSYFDGNAENQTSILFSVLSLVGGAGDSDINNFGVIDGSTIQHGTVLLKNVKAINVGFNDESSPPAPYNAGIIGSYGQAAFFVRNADKFVIEGNCEVDVADAAFSLSYINEFDYSNAVILAKNCHFEGLFQTQIKNSYSGTLIAKDCSNTIGFWSTKTNSGGNIITEKTVYTVTSVTSNSVFTCDQLVQLDDFYFFPGGLDLYIHWRSGNNVLTRSVTADYVGSTQTITLASATSSNIQVGDEFVITMNGIRMGTYSGLNTVCENCQFDYMYDELSAGDEDSGGIAALNQGTFSVKKAKVRNSFKSGIWCNTNATLTIDSIDSQFNGERGVLNQGTMAIYGGQANNNNQRGSAANGGRVQGVATVNNNIYLSGVQATDNQGTKTQEIGFQAFGTATNNRIFGCDFSGNSTNDFGLAGASTTDIIIVANENNQAEIFNLLTRPPSIADVDAPSNSVYYSTTQSKLVYKDSGGVVNDLY